MSRDSMRTRVTAFIVAAGIGVSLVSSSASADDHVEIVVGFDASAGELSEGVAVDKKGNVFVSLSPLGQLVKVPAGTSEAVPFGQVDGLGEGDIGLIGLATDAPGNVYGAVVSQNPDARGVWRFDRKTGEEERIAGTEQIAFPNSVAFDKRGTMFITDTVLGAVWRVPRGGSAQPWLVDPLLEGDGSIGFGIPLGANGIAVKQGTVYVGVTERGAIVTIPIATDGSAGDAEDLVVIPGALVDGLALDVQNNIYFANPVPGAVIKVSASGDVETVATNDDGLDGPTSVAFGTGRGEKQTLYAVSFSVALGTPLGAGPSLAAIDVGVPGWPVP